MLKLFCNTCKLPTQQKNQELSLLTSHMTSHILTYDITPIGHLLTVDLDIVLKTKMFRIWRITCVNQFLR